MSNEHKDICKNVVYPYGNGDAAERIANKSIEVVREESIDLKKKFYAL